MTLRSTARGAYHVALDFWGCLRRFADGKAVNGYDDHMAGVLAEGNPGIYTAPKLNLGLIPESSGTPSADCPVHGQWCQVPGPAPWCRQTPQTSAVPGEPTPPTAAEPPAADPPPQVAGGTPTFTAGELNDAARSVQRMALLRGAATGRMGYWLALSAKFYDAADAIATADDSVTLTLANDPGSVHDRALRQRLDEDERQK